LTDVDALYTDNPRINPEAKPIRVVKDLEELHGNNNLLLLFILLLIFHFHFFFSTSYF